MRPKLRGPKVWRPRLYPSEWPRRLGLISPLGLEIFAEDETGDFETFNFRAVASVEAGTKPPSGEVKGEIGILKKRPPPRDKLIYEQNTTPEGIIPKNLKNDAQPSRSNQKSILSHKGGNCWVVKLFTQQVIRFSKR